MSAEELHPTGGYEHVTIAEPGRTAYLAGQCPVDAEEQVVGVGDLDRQIDQVAANALAALASVGAKPEDVVRSVIYVVSADSETVGGAWHRFAERTDLAPAFKAASTVVGVMALGYPDQLVELDLTARLPTRPIKRTLREGIYRDHESERNLCMRVVSYAYG